MKMRGSVDFLTVTDREFVNMNPDRLVDNFGEYGLKNIIRGMAFTSNTHGRVIAENNRRQTVLEHTINLLVAHLGSGVSLRTNWIGSDREMVRVLRMAAFFHDSGKISKNGSGRPVGVGHDEISISNIKEHGNDLMRHFSEEQIMQMIHLVEFKDVFFGDRVNIDTIMRASYSMPGVSSPETAMRLLLTLWIADSSTLPQQVWYREIFGRYPLRELFKFMADNISDMTFGNIMRFCDMANGPVHEIPDQFYI